ncbi:MAG: anti-sigma F factor [Clostridia bacterium]|nr:anti-sigma F factor [Clostridia bacterium]
MKNTINKMSMTFPSRSSNEGFARSAAAAFIAQLDPTVDELSDIKTAVSEAVTNCIVHAYKERVGDITLTVEIGEDNMVEISVRDKGCGIEDIKKACEPMFTTGGQERSGMGFTIMESFMDSMKVRSAPGKGTTVKMRKRISVRGMFR